MRSILSLTLVMLMVCTSVDMQAQELRSGLSSICGKRAKHTKSRSARHATFLPTSQACIPWQGNTPRRRARRRARRINRSLR